MDFNKRLKYEKPEGEIVYCVSRKDLLTGVDSLKIFKSIEEALLHAKKISISEISKFWDVKIGYNPEGPSTGILAWWVIDEKSTTIYGLQFD